MASSDGTGTPDKMVLTERTNSRAEGRIVSRERRSRDGARGAHRRLRTGAAITAHLPAYTVPSADRRSPRGRLHHRRESQGTWNDSQAVGLGFSGNGRV